MINRPNIFAAAAAAIAIGLPSFAGAHGAHDRPARFRHFGYQPVIATSASRHYFMYSPAALARMGGRFVGPANLGNAWVTFHVETAMRNAAGLKAYAKAANTPGSVYYRRWIGPSAIADSFGTPVAQYNAAAAYFRGYGMHVKTWPMRTSLTITAQQKQIETALGTRMGVFSLRGERFFGIAQSMSVPANVSIDGISSITNARLMHTDLVPGGPSLPISGGFSNARVNGASPQMLAGAYELNTAYAKGYTGKGINLGIVGTGPIAAADVPAYKALFGLKGSSTVTQVTVSIDGDTPPPPTTGPCSGGTSTAPSATCNPEDIEAQLDTEQAAGLAPDANVLFYLGYNAANDTQGIGSPDDEVDQAIMDNRVDILSLSYGACETLEMAPVEGILTASTTGGDATGHDPTEFAELATEGVAVFVASGDSGSAGCQRSLGMLDTPSVGYPSSDPNVVAVGGTSTPIGPDGRLTGPIVNWGEQTKSGGAAGAGISVLFNPPTFETAQASSKAICVKGIGVGSPLSGGGRCNPDVALDADPFTGAAVLSNSGLSGGTKETPEGGTSQAAPDMAAMWAVVLSACEQVTSCQGPQPPNVVDPVSGYAAPSTIPRYRMGNPNFLMYPMLSSAAYHAVFYDIVYGNDAVPPYAAQLAASEESALNDYTVTDPGSVSAGPGFDNASGIGFPEGYELLKALIPNAN